MEFTSWIVSVVEERLGENLDVIAELSEPSSTEILIAKLEVIMSKDEFKDLISKAGECNNNCGEDFARKCNNCKINQFTTKFTKFLD